MSLRPCCACEKRADHKLSSLYWSWNLADRRRVAYRQLLCLPCFILRVAPYYQVEFTQEILCPSCHSPSGDDMDPIFCKVYVPGQPVQELELATCPVCAVAIRAEAIVNAELLPDRNPEFGGLAPKPTATDVWAALGLRP